MEKKFVVFCLGKQREIYGDDSYHVLGERMGQWDTKEEAIEHINRLDLKHYYSCTILEVWSKERV